MSVMLIAKYRIKTHACPKLVKPGILSNKVLLIFLSLCIRGVYSLESVVYLAVEMRSLNAGLAFFEGGPFKTSPVHWTNVIIAIRPSMEAAKYAAVCTFDAIAIALAAWFAAWAEGDMFMMNDR
jgi:hypothetical protein